MTLAADDIAAPSGPQGRARRWTDEELALLALLLLTDAASAVFLWDELAPTPLRGLLEAVPFDAIADKGTFTSDATDDAKFWRDDQWKDFGLRVGDRDRVIIAGNTHTRLAFPRSAGTTGQAYRITTLRALPLVWFDAFTQRYGLGNRGYIRDVTVIAALETVRRNAEARAESDITGVYEGTTDIGTWQQRQAQELRTLALMTAAFGVGGVARLDTSALSIASAALAFPLQRLQRFALQIERGVVNAAEAFRRAVAYPSSTITNVYHEARRKSHIAVGFKEELNVLDDEADHCEPDPRAPEIPNCPEVTSRGWVKIGTLPPIGTRRCKWNCRCRFDFRRTP